MVGLFFDSNRTGNYEIYGMSLPDGAVAQLTNDTRFDSFWPKLSPDQSQILFHRTPRGLHDLNFTAASTWRMMINGSGLTRLLAAATDEGGNEHGWTLHGHVEWHPDGQRLVFAVGLPGQPFTQLAETNSAAQSPRMLTSEAAHHIDPSYGAGPAPIVFSRSSMAASQGSLIVYALQAGGGAIPLTGGVDVGQFGFDYDPYFSPDGDSLAWLRISGPTGMGPATSDIMPLDRNGGVRNLTGGRITTDAPYGSINSKPCWGRDVRLIAFHGSRNGIDAGFRLWMLDPFAAEPHLTIQQLDVGQPAGNEYPN